MITIKVPEYFCDVDKELTYISQDHSNLLELMKVLETGWPVKLFPEICRSEVVKTPLDPICGKNIDCFIEKSAAAILIEMNDDDSRIVRDFWHAVAFGTFVIYHSPLNLNFLAPKSVAHNLDSMRAFEGLKQTLYEIMNINHLKQRFQWKNEPTFFASESNISKLLNFTVKRFPCNLCAHVRLRKQYIKKF